MARRVLIVEMKGKKGAVLKTKGQTVCDVLLKLLGEHSGALCTVLHDTQNRVSPRFKKGQGAACEKSALLDSEGYVLDS